MPISFQGALKLGLGDLFAACSWLKRGEKEFTKRAVVVGSGCSSGVQHLPQNQEIMGRNPTMCWAVFIFLLLNSASLNRSLAEDQQTLFP